MPGLIYLNDGLVPATQSVNESATESATESAIGAADRGFTLGDGAFETIAVTDGEPQRLERHLARLDKALHALYFDTCPTTDQIGNAVIETAAANGIVEGALRITVSRGIGARGLAIPEAATPTLVIAVSDGLPPQAAISARICRTTRRNAHSPLSRIKSLAYLDNILALEEARANGADDAIMLNTDGALACASAANLFLVKDGLLFTPRIEDGVLPGLKREDIISRMDVRVETLDEAALQRADEAFLTNSLSIRPLIRVDDQAIGGGTVGPITTEIQQRFGPTSS